MPDKQASHRMLKEAKPLRKLPPHYIKFVNAYIETGNQTQAAIVAGYEPQSAHQQGWRLSKNVDVRAAIDQRIADLDKDAAITREHLISFQFGIAEQALEAKRYGEATAALKEVARFKGYHVAVQPRDDAALVLKELRESIYRERYQDGTATEAAIFPIESGQ